MAKKPAERLQAQVEAFAGSEPFPEKEDDRDRVQLLIYADRLARGEDHGPEFERLAEQYQAKYVDFLRQKENRKLVERLEESIVRYEGKFSAAAARLQAEIAQMDDPEKHPSFLGRGGTAATFKAEVDGVPHAFKLFDMPDSTEGSIEDRVHQIYKDVRDLLYGEGVDHVPQLVTHSLKDQVVVMTLMPGECVAENIPGDSSRFTDEDLIQLIQTVKDLRDRGLGVDSFPQNLLFDGEKGFSVLDSFYVGDNPKYSIEKQVMRLRRMLIGIRYADLGDYLAQHRESLGTGLRLLQITKKHFPDIFRTFQEVEPLKLLKIDAGSSFLEFNPSDPYDQHILTQAKAILES